MKIAIAASGGLGLRCLQSLPTFVELICVLTDAASAPIGDYCTQKNIPVFKGNPRNNKAAKFIAENPVDVLFSINYIFVVDKAIIDWPSRYAFNIHGSLLPKYRGRTPHVWAIINNEQKTGFTVHLIDEGCDTGPIVMQKKIDITPSMTGADVLNIFNEQYPSAVIEVLRMASAGEIKTFEQDQSKATYFGKRTPEDGLINWEWQRERIHNWVRAQAKPYPGAFALYQGKKVIIHRIGFDDAGFDCTEANGKILQVIENKPVIKAANGAIRIEEIEAGSNIEFIKGEYFHA